MRVAIFYFVFIGVTGLTLPYFPRYLNSLGFSGARIANVNSIAPVLLIFIPLIWGFAADRTGMPVRLVRIATACMALALIPLGFVSSFAGVMSVWFAYAFFQSPILPLADSIAIVEARRIGTDFSRLRLWGSIGFVAVLFAFGIYLEKGGRIDAVPITGLCIAAAAAVCAFLLVQHESVKRTPPSFHDARKLIHQPALMWFLIAGLVHQASLSPYYLFYPLHLKELNMGEPVVYWSIGVGVAAEILMFQFARFFLKRFPIFPMIGFCFIVSIVRWYLIPLITSEAQMIALQSAHAFTFALCFAASISYLESNVAEPLRATGRALYSAISQGVGSVAGHQLAGHLKDRFGIGASFKAAAAIEVLAIVPLIISAWYVSRKVVTVDPFKEAPPATTEEV